MVASEVGVSNNRQPFLPGTQYLSMLQWYKFRIIRGADHFIVRSVSGRSPPWGYFVACQTLRIADCVVLPGFELDAIHGSLQNPVSGARGIGGFNDDVRNLKDLKQRHQKTSIQNY